MTQPNNQDPINNVEWDQESESYKVVTNPVWNLPTQVEVYSDLVNQGFNDEVSTSILAMINQTRPVYRCSCSSDHQIVGYSFNPCPCHECDIHARRDGVDINAPLSSISLHQNTVHVIGDMIRRNYLQSINDVLPLEYFINIEDFQIFENLLIKYGNSYCSWSQIVDEFEQNDIAAAHNNFNVVISILEKFWLDFMLNNPNIQPPSSNSIKE